ncbi:hypothetical protein HUT06_08300 [Actinomadura sp. NAK00032]|uniref:protein kinase domain-containing protein n=1 Tax=Actinomadura sp. NAK00032 TaxID=2742128 RepID=UPI001591D9DD|nr:hypothetical protein [Actinomadura sp. NAK00032]QKW34028.1 hypothetical protein HUT06_08300 [Actinomadura sp. NAK00032]
MIALVTAPTSAITRPRGPSNPAGPGARTSWRTGGPHPGTDVRTPTSSADEGDVQVESGLRLTERYRLVERLGDGGTLEVWRAFDELLDRPVAVKLPAPGGPPRAFQDGVNRAAGLSHPALETVFDGDLTRDASGRLVPYLVTEFLDGESLAGRLRRGRLTAREAASVCGRVAAALAAAHAAGVTHGDLRPGKIMLLRDEVRLVDTGIGGIVRGAAAPVPAAADVRALGAVLAACLPSGTSGELPALAARCLSEDAPSARQVADALIRDDPPPRRVRMAPAIAAAPQRTRALRPPAIPRPRHRRGARIAAATVAATVPAAVAVVLASAPRAPVTVAPPVRSATVPPTTVPPATVPPATAPERPPAAEPAGTRVRGALGRLRPIVSRGHAAGQIRSDVALDLTNVITSLEHDLTADRDVDVGRRIALLHDKIATRRREHALSPGLADELNRVLATIAA